MALPIALLLRLAPLLMPVLDLVDRLLKRTMPTLDGKKTEVAATLKVILMPLLAALIPGFQEQMAALALDTAVELALTLAVVHRLVKLLIVRLKASVQ